jgi:membrane peptidoglycan carboxypeptidase
VLFDNPGKAERAVSESTAFLMSSMLADVVNAGTAYKARQAGFTLPAAGKTGTTNDYVDAWFVGYTPHLVTGVWVGFDQPKTIVRNGYGGDLAVPIWASFMKTATRGDKADWFDRPSNVIGVNVCRLSGKLPNDGCDSVEVVRDDGSIETRSMVYTDYFVRGTQPTTICPLHPGRSLLATMAGALGIQVGKPVPTDASMMPPPEAATAGAVKADAGKKKDESKDNAKADNEDGKKKKRGFWSRIFGIGGGDDKDKKSDDKDKKSDEKDQKSGEKGKDGKKPGGGR